MEDKAQVPCFEILFKTEVNNIFKGKSYYVISGVGDLHICSTVAVYCLVVYVVKCFL